MIWTHHKRPAPISPRAKAILHRRGHAHDCQALREMLLEFDATLANLYNKVEGYKWAGMIALVLIPVTASALSTLLGIDAYRILSMFPSDLDKLNFWLGVILTVMTLGNAIFRPAERFRTACLISIHIEHIVEDLLGALETEPVTEKALHELVQKFRRKMEPSQRALIALFHPDITRAENIKAIGSFDKPRT